MRLAPVVYGQGGLTPTVSGKRLEDDPGEDEYDDPRQREKLEGTPLAGRRPRLGRVGIERRRSLPRHVILALEHLRIVLDFALVCHGRVVPSDGALVDDQNVREASEPSLQVEPVADEEVIGHGEADVAERDVIDKSPIGPV
jgi:hypothetical protein